MEENLIREFIAEAEEHLFLLEPNLLRLEKEPDNLELINDIFLATHGIKGTASYVGLPHISSFTHSLETLFDRLRKREIRTSPELIDILLEGLDTLKFLVNSVSLGNPTPDTSALEMKLTQWQEQELGSLGDGAVGRWRDREIGRTAPQFPTSPSPDLPTSSVFDPDCLKTIDPEDREIFADIADQQIQFMQLALDRIRELRSVNPETAYESIDSLLKSLTRAFRNIQSSAAMLCVEAFDRVLAEYARYFSPLESLSAPLTENDVTNIARTVRILEDLTKTISAGSEKEGQPPSQPSQSVPPAAELPRIDLSFGQHTLRVNAERVDDLLNLVGELAINRARLVQVGKEIKNIHEALRAGEASLVSPLPLQRKKAVRFFKKLKDAFDEITVDLGRLTNQLQEGTMRIRMIPISQVVHRFPRMVRDLSRQAGKDVTIEIYGADTELDKTVVDIIGDPLIHIIRNAIDHGIELPGDRQTCGKPPQGKIILSAYHQGNQVVIAVEDDGKGIDLERVKQKALQQHLIAPQEANTLPAKEIAYLIFHPGFSTVETASTLSGRGVGLHIVKRYLEKLNGAIELETIPGKGSIFTLKLPLTLAIIPALLVSVSSEIFALPLISVEEAIRISDQEIRTIGSRKVIRLREKMIPLVDLTDLLGVPILGAPGTEPDVPGEEVGAGRSENEARKKLYGVIISDGVREIGLIIDALLGESDIVIKAIDADLVKVEGVSGASIQGDGQVALVLDVASLIDLASKVLKVRRSELK